MEQNGTTIEDFCALAARAESALSSGDWATAAVGYEALVQRRPEQFELKYELARAYKELGRLQDAIELLNDPSMAGLEKTKRRLTTMCIRAKNYAAAMPLVDELGRVAGRAVPHSIGANRAGDPAVLLSDPAKAKRELGWSLDLSDLDTIVLTPWAWYRRAAR